MCTLTKSKVIDHVQKHVSTSRAILVHIVSKCVCMCIDGRPLTYCVVLNSNKRPQNLAFKSIDAADSLSPFFR